MLVSFDSSSSASTSSSSNAFQPPPKSTEVNGTRFLFNGAANGVHSGKTRSNSPPNSSPLSLVSGNCVAIISGSQQVKRKSKASGLPSSPPLAINPSDASPTDASSQLRSRHRRTSQVSTTPLNGSPASQVNSGSGLIATTSASASLSPHALSGAATLTQSTGAIITFSTCDFSGNSTALDQINGTASSSADQAATASALSSGAETSSVLAASSPPTSSALTPSAGVLRPETPNHEVAPKKFDFTNLVDIPCTEESLAAFRLVHSAKDYQRINEAYQKRVQKVGLYHKIQLAVAVAGLVVVVMDQLLGWTIIDLPNDRFFGLEVSTNPFLQNIVTTGTIALTAIGSVEGFLNRYYLVGKPNRAHVPQTIKTVRDGAVQGLATEYQKIAKHLIDEYIELQPLLDLPLVKVIKEMTAEQKNDRASDQKDGIINEGSLVGTEVEVRFGSLDHLRARQLAFKTLVVNIAKLKGGIENNISQYVKVQTCLELGKEETTKITASLRTAFAIVSGKGIILKSQLPDADKEIIKYYNDAVKLVGENSSKLLTRFRPILADLIYDPIQQNVNSAFLNILLQTLLSNEKFKAVTIAPQQLSHLVLRGFATRFTGEASSRHQSYSPSQPLQSNSEITISSLATSAVATQFPMPSDEKSDARGSPTLNSQSIMSLDQAERLIQDTLASLEKKLEDRILTSEFKEALRHLETKVSEEQMQIFVKGQISAGIAKLKQDELTQIGKRLEAIEHDLATKVTVSSHHESFSTLMQEMSHHLKVNDFTDFQRQMTGLFDSKFEKLTSSLTQKAEAKETNQRMADLESKILELMRRKNSDEKTQSDDQKAAPLPHHMSLSAVSSPALAPPQPCASTAALIPDSPLKFLAASAGSQNFPSEMTLVHLSSAGITASTSSTPRSVTPSVILTDEKKDSSSPFRTPTQSPLRATIRNSGRTQRIGELARGPVTPQTLSRSAGALVKFYDRFTLANAKKEELAYPRKLTPKKFLPPHLQDK